MALSGYFYGTTANAWIKPKLSWSAVQSVEGNYSDITVTLSYSRTNTGYKTEGEWSGAIVLGDQRVTGKKHIAITYQSDTEAMTAAFRVPHDEYGALSVTVSAEGMIYDPADSSLRSTKISGELQPDTIPRASAVTVSSAAIGSCATVAVVRKSADFTHSLQYTFGTLTGWLDAAGQTVETEQLFSAEVVNFLLPETFYEEIPDKPTGEGTLICRTYQGEVCIGECETRLPVTTDPNLCGPTLQVTARDVEPKTLALTGREDLFVRYLSRAECTVTAGARKGATLVEILAEGQKVEEETFVIDTVQTGQVQFTATDSRGYTKQFTLQLQLLPYVLLTTNAFVQRTDPTGGDAVLTLQGSAWKGSFNGIENALTAAYTVNGITQTVTLAASDDHTYRLEIPLSGLDYRQSHPVEVAVADSAMTVTQSLTVHKGLPVFDWGEEDFRFHVPVELPALTIGGIPLADYIRSIINN